MDIDDEARAFETQYLFRGSGFEDFLLAGNVTQEYVLKLGYNDMPNASLNLNSTGQQIYDATNDRWFSNYPTKTAREIFNSRNDLLIQSGKQPLFIYNDVLRTKKK